MAVDANLLEEIRRRTPKPYPPASEAAIMTFELSIGVRLPADYRLFLKSHNGGWLNQHIAIRQAVPEQPDDAIQDFYGVGAIPDRGTLDYHLSLFDDNPFPIKILVIGGTVGACYICLYMFDDDFGAVYYKDFDAWYRIADSFTQFLNLLAPKLDRELPEA